MNSNEPLPFKDPPQLMEQTINLAPTVTTFEENVADFKQGRHLQRMAVAREFASGRPLIDFIRAVESSEHTIRKLLTEARNLELIEGKNLSDETGCHTQLSQALSTQKDAAEFAQMPVADQHQLKEEIEALADKQEEQQAKAKELLAAARDRKAKKQGVEPKKQLTPEELEALNKTREEHYYRNIAKDLERSVSLVGFKAREDNEIGSALQRLADMLADFGFHANR